MSKNYNSQIIKWLSAKPIAFNPIVAKSVGGAINGLFLCQVLFWWGKSKDQTWIQKTISEFEEETSLTRSEQDRAIRDLKKLKIIDVQKFGKDNKRHFAINQKELEKLLISDCQE